MINSGHFILSGRRFPQINADEIKTKAKNKNLGIQELINSQFLNSFYLFFLRSSASKKFI